MASSNIELIKINTVELISICSQFIASFIYGGLYWHCESDVTSIRNGVIHQIGKEKEIMKYR